MEPSMATLSDLVLAVARVEGVDPATVNLIARIVREAGLIATGGRGPSAAQMGLSDASNLLIGVNAAKRANDAARVVAEYSRMVPYEYVAETERYPLKDSGTLGEAIEQLIQAVATAEFPESFMGRTVPAPLRESFGRGYANIFLTFNVSYLAATLRIQETLGVSVPDSTMRPLSTPLFLFNFFPKPSPKMRPELQGRISYAYLAGQIPGDRIEEATISHRTIYEVAKLIFGGKT
jgi:hypothetical protein